MTLSSTLSPPLLALGAPFDIGFAFSTARLDGAQAFRAEITASSMKVTLFKSSAPSDPPFHFERTAFEDCFYLFASLESGVQEARTGLAESLCI